MKFALDTEFLEDGRSLTLLSIGLVAEDGREYYAEVADVRRVNANEWVRTNVLVHLTGGTAVVRSRAEIREELLAFVGSETPQFWGWYAAHDWVLFGQLIGDFDTWRRVVPHWPILCFDLQQVAEITGKALRVPDQMKHHALDDARWVMAEIRRLAL